MGLVIERWRDVVGYEGRYQVSDRGSVRSLDREVSNGGLLGPKKSFTRAGNPLHPGINQDGYLRVTLSRDGATRRVFVHVMVLQAFVGFAPEGAEACHNDGNPANNTLNNLRWDTHSNNIRDIKYHGSGYKLRPDDVRGIRRLAGVRTQRQIAAKFGCSQAMVSLIHTGKQHLDVE